MESTPRNWVIDPTQDLPGQSTQGIYMQESTWEKLPIEVLPLNLLIWQGEPHRATVQGMLVTPCMQPIHVETLCNGHYYVHEGRARIVAAYYRGASHIEGHVLDHWAPTNEAAAGPAAPHTQTDQTPTDLTPTPGEDGNPHGLPPWETPA